MLLRLSTHEMLVLCYQKVSCSIISFRKNLPFIFSFNSVTLVFHLFYQCTMYEYTKLFTIVTIGKSAWANFLGLFCILIFRSGSSTAPTSKMERFVIIVNSWSLDPPLDIWAFTTFHIWGFIFSQCFFWVNNGKSWNHCNFHSNGTEQNFF